MYLASGSVGASKTIAYDGNDEPIPPTIATLNQLAARVKEMAQAAIDGDAEAMPSLATLDALQLALLLADQTLSSVDKACEPTAEPRATAVFRREGSTWHVAFAEQSIRLRDSLGLGYLRQLLQRPGEKIHCVVLAVNLEMTAPAANTRRRNWLGPRIASASSRLSALQHGLEDATWNQDAGLAGTVRAGIDEATSELLQALGHDGAIGETRQLVERSRLNVSRAIVASLNRISRHHAALGTHLRTTIRLGAFCAYVPDARVPMRWDT